MQNLLKLQKRTQLSLTVWVTKMQSQTVLLRFVDRLKKQNLNLIKKNYRKDLQNWLAV